MNDEHNSPPFSQTGQDLVNLKQTATEAVSKTKGQLNDLRAHVQSETGDQIQNAKQTFSEVVGSAKSYAIQHLLVTIALAAGIGFFYGRSRSCSNS
jgi:ElaB/YqjD/DUF883 family membrane-anchored ribosome-binding protein